MTAFYAMIRKLVTDTRWTLGLSSLALFGLSWLFVFMTSRIESQVRRAGLEGPGPARFIQRFGGADMDFSSAAIEVMFWNHPFIFLTVAVWAIGRGSAAVAAEVERGTMDLILSRPVSRSFYLNAHVLLSVLGLLALGVALVAGNQVGNRYNVIDSRPSAWLLAKPALNLVALGLAIYGYTLFFSAIDSVRWRANLLGSVLTLAGFILHVVVNLPTLEDWKWLDRLSIFKAYNPVELVTKGETFGFNVTVLTALGAVGIVLAFVAFAVRDLPANS
jgi:ABC-2 type transport system permease protein